MVEDEDDLSLEHVTFLYFGGPYYLIWNSQHSSNPHQLLHHQRLNHYAQLSASSRADTTLRSFSTLPNAELIVTILVRGDSTVSRNSQMPHDQAPRSVELLEVRKFFLLRGRRGT